MSARWSFVFAFSEIGLAMRKLLANENFPYASIHYLRSKGFDVLSIGMDNPSIKDAEIMTIAIIEKRTILTFDRDYGELIFIITTSQKWALFIYDLLTINQMSQALLLKIL